MINLYQYQEKLICSMRGSFARGNNRVVLCAPTGSGKTVMFSYMIRNHIDKGGKVLVLTDRTKLLDQATSSFGDFGIEPQHLVAGKSDLDTKASCTVAMIETIYRRAIYGNYRLFINSCTMIVIDEAHKTCFEKLFKYFNPNAFVIGATATPFRKGGQSSMDSIYQDLIQDVDTLDLLKIGKLSKCRTYGISVPLEQVKKIGGDFDMGSLGQMYDSNKIYEGVAYNYRKHANNTKAICFASSVDSAERLYAELDLKEINVLIVHSKKSKDWNNYALDTFYNSPPNKGLILINVGILTAGYDCPDIQTVILYRATTSLPLFLQMVGRGSRITEDKQSFKLLDFGNNVKRHNFWEAPRIWSLEKKRHKTGVAPIKECPMCEAFLPASAKICEYCEHEFEETQEEKQKNKFAELKELSKGELLQYAKHAELREKALLCKQKLINPFWVLHNIDHIQDARIFCNLMGYKRTFEYANRNRFKVFQV